MIKSVKNHILMREISTNLIHTGEMSIKFSLCQSCNSHPFLSQDIQNSAYASKAKRLKSSKEPKNLNANHIPNSKLVNQTWCATGVIPGFSRIISRSLLYGWLSWISWPMFISMHLQSMETISYISWCVEIEYKHFWDNASNNATPKDDTSMGGKIYLHFQGFFCNFSQKFVSVSFPALKPVGNTTRHFSLIT